MRLKAFSRIGLFVIATATALIAFEATSLRGQNDDADQSDLTFDLPTTDAGNSLQTVKPLPSAAQPNDAKPGRTNISQASGPLNDLSRVPITGTEPKSTAPQRRTNLNNRKMSDQVITNRGLLTQPNMIAPAARSSPTPATQGSAPAPTVKPSLASHDEGKRVTQTGHYYPTDVVDRDGGEVSQLKRQQRKAPVMPLVSTAPSDQTGPPGIRGALLGLNGTTASELAYQLKLQIAELQRENEELRRETGTMMSRIKEGQDQLIVAVREIQVARKEVAGARGDLDRLRTELQNLREKVRLAEKEHSAVLQTIGPILQQLLEADELSSLPPNPVERD